MSPKAWIVLGDIGTIILAIVACCILGPLYFFILKGFERFQEQMGQKRAALYIVFYGLTAVALAVLYYYASTKFLVFLCFLALVFWRWVVIKNEA